MRIASAFNQIRKREIIFLYRDLSLLTHSVGGQIAFTVNVPFGTGKKHFPKSFQVKKIFYAIIAIKHDFLIH